jgi:phytoene/squalene synthetase
VQEELEISLPERVRLCLLALYGFGRALLETVPDMPLTDAEREQVRAALSEVEEARRQVAVAADTLERIAFAVRDRHKNN